MMTTERGYERLPPAVYELALRLGASPQVDPRSVRLTQTGRMKTKLDGKSWMPFTATQSISTHLCEFDWRARLGPLGMVSVRDALAGAEGRLDVTALGLIPIVRAQRTTALLRGELMRYLAEIPWAPDAIFHNSRLRWRADGPNALVVSAGADEATCEVVLSLDSDGRIAGAFASDRPRSATAPTLPTPWRGKFSDYRLHGGRWLPFAGEVGWEIDGQLIIYWHGRVDKWEMELA